jgi:hypothetical protein
VIFAGTSGVEPMHLAGDHFGDAASYPTILADEINLDSPADQREMMLRSVRALPSGSTAQTLLLLGAPEEPNPRRRPGAGRDAETLLNSRGGRMHLFPNAALPAEIAFHHFQASGGFLVSAGRNAQGVYHLEIEPRRDNRCQVMNPWPGKAVNVHEFGKSDSVPVEVDNKNGECLSFPAVAGHRYLVERK